MISVLSTYRVHTYLGSTYSVRTWTKSYVPVRTWGEKYVLKRSGTRWYDNIDRYVPSMTRYVPSTYYIVTTSHDSRCSLSLAVCSSGPLPACWVRVSFSDSVAAFAGGPVDWVTLAQWQWQGHGQMQAHKKQLIIDMYSHSTPLQRIYN